MLCTRPFVRGITAFACGQCVPCRINRRRLWTHRMLLEAHTHAESAFVTLTYDEAHYPADGSLVPEDLKLWLKRLRQAIWPIRFRYYAVGEYGGQTWRPHYHAALFGILPDETLVSSTWTKGYTMVGPLSPQSMAYVAGYVTKKMTRRDDSRLSGRVPEFARMSLRPGIGAPAMVSVARVLQTKHGAQLVSQLADVPTTLAHGKQLMPLGRYLKTRLCAEAGIEVPDWTGTTLGQARLAELLELQKKVGRAAFRYGGVHTEWEKVAQVEARARIWGKHETL